MENRREEFLKTVCQIYMAAVLVVLPLYYIPGNGYDKLGDSKYYLYRNISLICMGICLAVQIIAVVRSCRMENSSSSGMYMRKTGGKIIRWCREHSVVTAVYGLSGYPYLSDQTGNLQDTAAGTVPRQRLWQYFHYVSHDHQCR